MFAVESKNIVGYNNTTVEQDSRRMSVAQFLGMGMLPTEMTIESFSQQGGDWGDAFLVTYNDNIQSTSENMFYLSDAMIKMYSDFLDPAIYKPGWYFVDGDGMPDITKGIQNPPLPYAQGCVINGAAGAGVAINSSGEVALDNYEIVVPQDARRMTGNVLPRTIDIGEIEQVGGDWGDAFLVTYNDNVQSTSDNMFYLSAAMIEMYSDFLDPAIYKPGWYFVDGDGMPDITKGIQHIDFDAGEGFVICGAASAGATIRFPKAIPDVK